MFRKAKVSARYVQHISQVHSILALVSAGIGISLVPETARKLHFEGGDLRELADPPVFAELNLVWNTDNDNPALPHFCDLVVRRFAKKAFSSRPNPVAAADDNRRLKCAPKEIPPVRLPQS
jgi:DNA-binding transcriptional LysR family regulator